jgi:hypothetical protein
MIETIRDPVNTKPTPPFPFHPPTIDAEKAIYLGDGSFPSVSIV